MNAPNNSNGGGEVHKGGLEPIAVTAAQVDFSRGIISAGDMDPSLLRIVIRREDGLVAYMDLGQRACHEKGDLKPLPED